MKFGHFLTTMGCGLLTIVSFAMFVWGATSPPGSASSRIFVWWLVVTGVGALVLAVAEALLIRRDVSEAKEGEQAVLGRAEELRRQREQERREQQEPEPALQQGQEPAPPVVTIPEAEIPADGIPTVEPDEEAPSLLRLPMKRAEKNLAQCPVCQTRIVEGELYVTCPGCDTEHHADCWQYNEGCGVFGCPW